MGKRIDFIKAFTPKSFDRGVIEIKTILKWFDACDAYWMHDGDIKNPHAELTSGMCSNGFFDCLRILKYVNLSEILANQLARKIRDEIGKQKVDWVIASPMAGITFGHDVARALKASVFMFTKKIRNRKAKCFGIEWQSRKAKQCFKLKS